MKTYSHNEIVNHAVQSIGLPCVYIANHLSFENEEEDKVWKYVVSELIKLYSPETQYTTQYTDIVSTVIHGGLVCFDSEEERDAFYKIFISDEVYSKAIYAVAYDSDGNALDENT